VRHKELLKSVFDFYAASDVTSAGANSMASINSTEFFGFLKGCPCSIYRFRTTFHVARHFWSHHMTSSRHFLWWQIGVVDPSDVGVVEELKLTINVIQNFFVNLQDEDAGDVSSPPPSHCLTSRTMKERRS
jgi:hypothetical protein